jgi:hypothetical protein
MAGPGLLDNEIPTKNPQLRRASRHAGPRGKAKRTAHGTAVRGDAREGTRGNGRVVVEVVGGITVYPARWPGDRWRATWYEGGVRRQCQAASEERLAARPEKVSARLAADAANMERSGAELIAFFLSPTVIRPASSGRASTPIPGPVVRAVRGPGDRPPGV